MLLALALLGACKPATGSDDEVPARLSVRLEADTVATAYGTLTPTARVVDARGRGVAGVPVRFSFAFDRNSPATFSAVTDAEGHARGQYTPKNHGALILQVGSDAATPVPPGGAALQDSAVTTVRVRQAVSLTFQRGGPVDSLSLGGPQCRYPAESDAYILGSGSTRDGNSSLGPLISYRVEDPTIAAVGRMPGTGGTMGSQGRIVYGLLAGSTRIIATGDEGGVDTISVRVSALPESRVRLAQMPADRPIALAAAYGPDSLVVARGDTATLTVATDPDECDGAVFPASFALAVESVNPAVARVEALENRRWNVTREFFSTSVGANVRVRGVAAGRTEVVATSPYTRPKRIRIIVR